MANYPNAPAYGVNYGAQDQTHPPYVPPAYPAQYMQPAIGPMGNGMSASYDVSNPMYEYSGTAPFSASAIASGVPPLPIFHGWNQNQAPLPVYNAHAGQQYMNYSDQNAAHSQHNSQYYVPQTPPVYQPVSQPPPVYDEGEVSESEFDGRRHQLNNSAIYGGVQHPANDRTAYADSSQQAMYSAPSQQNQQRPYVTANSFQLPLKNPPQTRVQQADDYSPRSSPVDTAQSQRAQKNFNHDPRELADNTKDKPTMIGGSDNSKQNGVAAISGTQCHTSKNSPPTVASTSKAQPASSSTGLSSRKPPKLLKGFSVVGARKQATSAIHNLVPLDIRLQDYLEDGIQEDIVCSLFDELKIPRTVGQANDVGRGPVGGSKLNGDETVAQPAASRPLNVITTLPSNPSPEKPPLAGEANSGVASSADGKKAVFAGSPLPKPNAQPITTTTAATPTASMSEKDRALQLKMEALRKSREERAQKAAAKASTKSPKDATPPVLAPAQPQPQPQPPFVHQSSTEPTLPPVMTIQPPVTQTKPLDTPMLLPSPKEHAVVQTQVSVIPGLFLTSTTSTSSPAASSNAVVSTPLAQSLQRKRPIAADFDPPIATANQFKRPFGQSRNERPVVIDVSEEEGESDDEDVAMELESQADQDSPIQTARRLSEHQPTAYSLPPLTDFPQRKAFVSPPISSAASTPPGLQSAAKLNTEGRPEVLQRKETEIELLKKKIAEAEARKKARQTPTGAQTPQASVEKKAVNDTDLASNVEASMKMQKLIGIAEDNVISTREQISETQTAEASKAADLKKAEDEQKRLRLEKLTSDLPLVEKEVVENQTKLEQMRAEMARLEEVVRKNNEAKRLLTEEMDRLGRETEEQLQAQREKLQSLANEEKAIVSVPIDAVADVNTETSLSQANTMAPVNTKIPVAQSLAIDTSQSALPSQENSQQLVNSAVVTDQVDMSARAGPPLVPENRSKPPESQVGKLMQVEGSIVRLPSHDQESKDRTSTDRDLEAALQEAVRAEADSHSHGYDDNEMETSFAPDPSQPAPETGSPRTDDAANSPEYSPVLERAGPIVAEIDMTEGSDIYEPPEGTPPVDINTAQPPASNLASPSPSPSFSPAPPEEDHEPDQIDETMDDIDTEIDKRQEALRVVNESQVLVLPVTAGPNLPATTTELFTPYQSPLKHFRAFRFHPIYKQEVAGGLRSLTYSNKIQQDKEFCRYELAGGICNDGDCEFQHFKSIELPADAVLTALGSPDQFGPAQREKFCEGLRTVLTDLRARKIKDFDVIADAIIAHRAKFLGDDSKILNLEGVTI